MTRVGTAHDESLHVRCFLRDLAERADEDVLPFPLHQPADIPYHEVRRLQTVAGADSGDVVLLAVLLEIQAVVDHLPGRLRPILLDVLLDGGRHVDEVVDLTKGLTIVRLNIVEHSCVTQAGHPRTLRAEDIAAMVAKRVVQVEQVDLSFPKHLLDLTAAR